MGTNSIEPDVPWILSLLESPQVKDRVYALRSLSEAPLADDKILTASEKLLTDETLAMLSIPYSFGEVRWLAAAAVAAMRRVLQRSDEVYLVDVPIPVTADKLGQLAREAGLRRTSGGVEGSLELLHRLRAMGGVPRRDLVRAP